MNKILLFSLLLIASKSISQVNQSENNLNLEQSKKILKKEINKILKETGIPSISLSLVKGDRKKFRQPVILYIALVQISNLSQQLP